MVSALMLEGWIIGLFVIINGIYIVVFPPVNDEPQGYAIIAIGIFIILATLHLTRNTDKESLSPPP
jgi:tetrahydromethanopterin S-methyltransferase subunit E